MADQHPQYSTKQDEHAAQSARQANTATPGPPAYTLPQDFTAELATAFDNEPSPQARTTIPPPPPPASAGSYYTAAAEEYTTPSIRPVPPASVLTRTDTLSPSDSISMYGQRTQYPTQHHQGHEHDPSRRQSDATLTPGNDYPSRKSGLYNDPYAAQEEDEDEGDRDYYPRKSAAFDPPYGHHPHDSQDLAHLPLQAHGGPMGYAEDEEDEARQFKNGQAGGLFANQYDGGSPGQFEDGTTARGAAGPGGLMGKFGRRSAGGESDVSKVEQQVERRRAGVFRQKYGILAFVLAIVYVIIFIVELIQSKARTGQAFQTKPQFQPMIGPPFEFFIAFPLGARFVPCMRNVPTHPTTTLLPCLNATTSSAVSLTTGSSALCPIWEICGMQSATGPYQTYRFVTAIFIHAGVIHLLFNILAQLTLVVQVEKILGTPAFALVYFAGGIGGNLLGGNFGLMSPALGASGAVYTAVGVEMTDLILNWHWEVRRKTRLTVSIVFAIIGLALGLLPGLDNFSHIGGFICGILGGLAFGPSIHPSKKHRVAVWAVRLVAFGLMVGFLVGLATNFFKSDDPAQACRWCRYLSCLPVFSQCKNDGLTMTTTSSAPTTSSSG
ncbi:hypothetical protein CF327_g4367 [Tilletia walkeri]|uniref:Rhomboid-type serine protease n=1 Tax=Tilletia walkeri TaxID=117179 RepID=A0A8X7NCU5_9BASI|nr:hypothetical protein CF327_g4367 [Tilletia walkeri]KAE8269661.1 hypothetical protein A4X09_0g2689 [Tilletia walkeri]